LTSVSTLLIRDLRLHIALKFLPGYYASAQSPSPPPRPSSSPPSSRSPPPPSPASPNQFLPLSLVDLATRASLCSRVADAACIGSLQWLIDLDPFPLTKGTLLNGTGLTCIGDNSTRCMWRSPSEYISYAGKDTSIYVPLGLAIRAANITRMLQVRSRTTSHAEFPHSASTRDVVPAELPAPGRITVRRREHGALWGKRPRRGVGRGGAGRRGPA
jgi:hypothetical protein